MAIFSSNIPKRFMSVWNNGLLPGRVKIAEGVVVSRRLSGRVERIAITDIRAVRYHIRHLGAVEVEVYAWWQLIGEGGSACVFRDETEGMAAVLQALEEALPGFDFRAPNNFADGGHDGTFVAWQFPGKFPGGTSVTRVAPARTPPALENEPVELPRPAPSHPAPGVSSRLSAAFSVCLLILHFPILFAVLIIERIADRAGDVPGKTRRAEPVVRFLWMMLAVAFVVIGISWFFVVLYLLGLTRFLLAAFAVWALFPVFFRLAAWARSRRSGH